MNNIYKNYYNEYNTYDDLYNCLTHSNRSFQTKIKDYGPNPFVINIEDITKENNTFRTTLWTGNHLQLTLMSIDVNDSIGLEIHEDTDQFLRIEEGIGLVQMGNSKDNLDFQRKVKDGYSFIVPAGKWHNLVNIGNTPIKLYSIYAPPHHPKGTINFTKLDSEYK